MATFLTKSCVRTKWDRAVSESGAHFLRVKCQQPTNCFWNTIMYWKVLKSIQTYWNVLKKYFSLVIYLPVWTRRNSLKLSYIQRKSNYNQRFQKKNLSKYHLCLVTNPYFEAIALKKSISISYSCMLNVPQSVINKKVGKKNWLSTVISLRRNVIDVWHFLMSILTSFDLFLTRSPTHLSFWLNFPTKSQAVTKSHHEMILIQRVKHLFGTVHCTTCWKQGEVSCERYLSKNP